MRVRNGSSDGWKCAALEVVHAGTTYLFSAPGVWIDKPDAALEQDMAPADARRSGSYEPQAESGDLVGRQVFEVEVERVSKVIL